MEDKDSLGFARCYYNHVRTLGLEIHEFKTISQWLIFLHSRAEQHCIVSGYLWGTILADAELYSAIDLTVKTSELLRGHLGTMTFGTSPYTKTIELFTDAYSHPDSDNRIFPMGTSSGSFILIPKDRQIELKEVTDV